jgi:serine O-acetyltransferase
LYIRLNIKYFKDKGIDMLAENKRINTRKDLKEWLKYENENYGTRWFRRILTISEIDILRRHQTLLRKTEYYTNTGHKIISTYYKVRLLRIQNKYMLHIPLNTCGKGLRLMHVGPVGRVTVGRDCVFHINTALVAGGTNDGVPYLGDGVILGIGAVIVGNVHIASNVAIGANAVVNKDFLEPEITIAGVPAQKISNIGSSYWNRS